MPCYASILHRTAGLDAALRFVPRRDASWQTHLLLAAGLVPLLLLLRVAKDAERARHLARLHGGQALAQVLAELLDEGGEEGVALVLLDKGGNDVARELVEVGLGLGRGRDGGLERIG